MRWGRGVGGPQRLVRVGADPEPGVGETLRRRRHVLNPLRLGRRAELRGRSAKGKRSVKVKGASAHA